MALVRVAMPETESHVALMVCALRAAGLPHLVHNAGFGGLYPGLQIGSYNTRSILVPELLARSAFDIIEGLHLELPTPLSTPTGRDKWRMLFEMILMGWFLPQGMSRRQARTEEP